MSTYLYGKLTKSKFYTPHRTYSHKTTFPAKMFVNTYLPCKLDDTNHLQIFYVSPVFNSYLTVEEENVYKLFSIDHKTTITKTKIEPNRLYTFRVVEETSLLRICEVFNNDLVWVGKEVTGKLQISKKKCEIVTSIGKGECILQNNSRTKDMRVLLWKIKDDKYYFVEVNNPVLGIIEVFVDAVRESFLIVSNENVKGMIFTNEQYKEKDTMKVYVKEELLGFYIFDLVSDLHIGSFIEAKVVKKSDTKTYLKYQIYKGFIDNTNIDLLESNYKTIKGRVVNFDNGKFELSQIQNISVPFDAVISESEEVEEDFESQMLTDLLAKLKRLTEDKKYKEVSEMYYKYINTLNTTDKDNFSLVYCNFLQFTVSDKHNLMKEIKKVTSFCTDNIYEKVGIVSDVYEVVEFCYKKRPTRDLFVKYIDISYKLGREVTDFTYMDIIIDYFYKYDDMPRIKTEKIVGTSKAGWMSYIKNETEDYKRILYRRVVNLNWKVGDMKEWYRMWMEYEKKHDGNIDEVRNRAKEFVDNIKNKQ